MKMCPLGVVQKKKEKKEKKSPIYNKVVKFYFLL